MRPNCKPPDDRDASTDPTNNSNTNGNCFFVISPNKKYIPSRSPMLNRRTEYDRLKCNTTTQPDSVKTYASVLCSILPEQKPECNSVTIKSTEGPTYDSEFPPLDTQPPLEYSIGDVGRRADMIVQPDLTLQVSNLATTCSPGDQIIIGLTHWLKRCTVTNHLRKEALKSK